MKSLLCRLGIHKWFNMYITYYWSKKCARCGKVQVESFHKDERTEHHDSLSDRTETQKHD